MPEVTRNSWLLSAWCKRLELSDAQIGLSIARLLPAPLTPVWNNALAL
ncbi:MAG: hypothetical protein SFV17_06055 [Candidatus Obscuribacter sp.]|nr:hypothetical protein [Candidatus Obscuribacter sp.]